MTELEPKPELTFNQMLEAKWAEGKLSCVGLDPVVNKIPVEYQHPLNNDPLYAITNFNRAIVDATIDITGAYKPNAAFYERYGVAGIQALAETVKYIKYRDPNMPVIYDAKRGDVDTSNGGYVEAGFDVVGADAITVSPWFGNMAMKPFLDRKEKGVIVLAKTSNEGAEEFQNRVTEEGLMWQVVAWDVANTWNYNGNCSIVVGARHPSILQTARSLAGTEVPILVPGVGSQGGMAEDAVEGGMNSDGTGVIISSSRDIIFPNVPSGFTHQEAVRSASLQLHNLIKQAKREVAKDAGS